jgi:hypothetical protein
MPNRGVDPANLPGRIVLRINSDEAKHSVSCVARDASFLNPET